MHGNEFVLTSNDSSNRHSNNTANRELNHRFFYRRTIVICPIVIPFYGTDYKITCVCLSFCQSVCKHSYGRNFHSILMKFCTVIRGPKSNIEFVWDKNLVTLCTILLQFKKCIMAYGYFKAESGSTSPGLESVPGRDGQTGRITAKLPCCRSTIVISRRDYALENIGYRIKNSFGED